jgi:hypothetical protein
LTATTGNTKKTWVMHPGLVELKPSEISLNWEADECTWIGYKSHENYKIGPNYNLEIKKVIQSHYKSLIPCYTTNDDSYDTFWST